MWLLCFVRCLWCVVGVFVCVWLFVVAACPLSLRVRCCLSVVRCSLLVVRCSFDVCGMVFIVCGCCLLFVV